MSISFLAEKSSSSLGVRHSQCFILATLFVALVATPLGASALPTPRGELGLDLKIIPMTVTATLGKAVQGAPFSGQISARGANGPYQFSVLSGALPQGLVLNPRSGAITGAPAQSGVSNFTVRVFSGLRNNHADLGLLLAVASTSPRHVTVTVTPTSVTIAAGATQQLSAVVQGGDNHQVRWSASAGSITAGGLFTAPTGGSSVLTATVTATSVAAPGVSASSTISVTPKSGTVTVTVTPTSATLASGTSQQLTAAVHGTTNTQVRWSASAGSISTSGLFVAPTVSSATTATVTVTSVASPGAAASSTISVTPVSSGSLSVATGLLPDATQGSAYSANLAATGGSLPYAWSVTSGSLPSGMSLNAAGGLSGNPSHAGSFSFTAKVTDAASHSASANLALIVDIPNTNGKFDGPAELPRVYMQSTLANTPANGKTWLVSDSTSLQAALNASACGDTIKLTAGNTFAGAFTFPGKSCDDLHWIIVRTSAPDSSLPAEGMRISPCYAGVASLPGRPALNCSSTSNVMAQLLFNRTSGSGPITFMAGANHYRILGLEITRTANAAFVGDLIFQAAGATGDHIIFDRDWIHGTAHDDTSRAIFLNGLTYTAIVDSYLNDFHCESALGSCTDAQAIAGGLGSNPGGPYKIVNNFLEASTEVIIFGGGPATLTPADIEIRHNHLFKPLTWMRGAAGFVGGNHGNPFTVKNHFELKNAQRVLFEGNVAENTWGGFSQGGFTVVLTPKNQGTPHGPVCPLCQVTDVTVRYSTFSHVGAGFQIANAIGGNGGPQFAGERYSIHDVILDDVSATKYAGHGELAQISSAPASPLLRDVQLNHITAFPSNMIFDVGNSASLPKMPNFMFANSIVTSGQFPVWTIGGGASNCAYNLSAPVSLLNNCFSPYTFSSNALIGVPSRYPASSWPSGNTLMPDGNSVGFVNFNNGNGGDYHLKTGSTFKGAASDGKDMGADVNAVNTAIAGAF